MIYLSVDKYSVKVLSLSKTILGQYTVSYFSKEHTSSILDEDSNSINTDLIASAIKEALTSAHPKPITEKDITLILPQSSFAHGRYSVPQDISDSAVVPFLKDKVRTELHLDIDTEQCDYIMKEDEDQSLVLFYCQKQEVFSKFQEAFDLLQLNIRNVIPDTLAFYKLFEKTLRKEKREKILYAAYTKEHPFGYLYDSLGLLKEDRFDFGDDFKPGVKKIVETLKKKESIELNRLILSGTQSNRVRQDLFTKDVGAWTNPLEKIIENFYQEEVRLIAPSVDKDFSFLHYDVCFGAFIFDKEHKDFSLSKKISGGKNIKSQRKISIPSVKIPQIMSIKTFLIFIISFIISFIIIFSLSKINIAKVKVDLPKLASKTTPKPTPKPTAVPTPTPSVAKEELKIKVLNGGGISGKAREVRNFLVEAGYSDVVADNVDGEFDYESTLIQVKKGKEDAVDFMKDDLKDYVTFEEEDISELDEEENADLIVIIGTDFGE